MRIFYEGQNMLKGALKVDCMENRDFFINNQKEHLKYYRRHDTIKSKNTVELKSFLDKKSYS